MSQKLEKIIRVAHNQQNATESKGDPGTSGHIEPSVLSGIC